MKRSTTLALFYGGVAVVSAVLLGIAFQLRARLPKPQLPTADVPVVATGRASVTEWFPIARDLEATDQTGRRVKLSDLKGKVWIVAEFFAVCPHCAVRNGEELRRIYEAFKDHPDFHIACISVDPDHDQVDKLSDYSSALGADAAKWWFLNAGEAAATHEYLEKELKFFGIRERKDPADIAANGRYAHDLGFLLVNRDFQVIGKWPLADARSEEAKQRDPGLYDRLKQELFGRIRAELDKQPARPADPTPP